MCGPEELVQHSVSWILAAWPTVFFYRNIYVEKEIKKLYQLWYSDIVNLKSVHIMVQVICTVNYAMI